MNPPVGKSGPCTCLSTSARPACGIVHHLDGCVDHFGQVVRRNVGRHAHRDAARPIDDEVGNAGRQAKRLEGGFVVVRRKIDRLLVDVGEHFAGHARHAGFGVAHRRRRVAVDRAEVALTVNHRIAQAEGLRHAHQGVVNRRVAVGMEDTHRLSDDLGALGVLLVVLQPHLVHRVEHAPVHGLEAVAHIGQRTPDDDRHRVLEIRPCASRLRY